MSIKEDFSWKVIKKSLVNSLLILFWNFGFILGCSKTLTAHADIMCNSAGFYMFIISICTFQVVHKYEYIGYLMYIIGVYFMFTDPHASKSNSEHQSYLGDFYAFAGAG